MRVLWTVFILPAVWSAPDMAFADDRGIILIHAGFGTPTGFSLRGRVLEDEGISAPDDKRGRLGNLVDSFKTFETDEIEGVTVEVSIAGRAWVAKTDDDGVWRVEQNRLDAPLPTGAVPLSVRVTDETDYEIPVARGVIHIIEDSVGVAVISDFDDTVVESKVTDKKRLLLRTATRNAAQLEPVPGVGEAYRAAQRAGARGFFYVSGSPQNLYERIAAFLEICALPSGPILLKNFGEDKLTEQIEYKVNRIERILQRFPKLRFVLVGDSGEKDPEIYAQIREKHPSRVAGVVIRKVEGADNGDARLAGAVVVADYEVAPRAVADMVSQAAEEQEAP